MSADNRVTALPVPTMQTIKMWPSHEIQAITRLVNLRTARMLCLVKAKIALPLALMIVFALSRIPGMLPQNFSAAYALVFCAGIYFTGRSGWLFPLVTMMVTDIGLDIYYWKLGYFHFSSIAYQLVNYGGYAAIYWLGRRFKPKSSFVSLLGGGILGALLFYLITNTASWLYNPEYSKGLAGLLKALTTGTQGWPQTWEFFRNTLLSGGLFTGLFVGAMKASEASESAKEKESACAQAPESETEPEEAEAGTPS